MQRIQMPAAPVVFGLILGPLLEENIRRTLIVNGDWSVFLTRPISATLIGIAAIALFYPASATTWRGAVRREPNSDPAPRLHSWEVIRPCQTPRSSGHAKAPAAAVR